MPHKPGKVRLIYDRRPQNALERDLSPEWLRLPHGCQFCEAILAPHQGLRGCADDLRNWFYQLRHEPDWFRRQAVGRRLRGQDFTSFGTDPKRNYRACMKVVCMGDRNGVPFAQEAHEEILRRSGLMRDENVLQYGGSTPHTDVWEGTYVDDHILSLRVPLNRMKCTPGHDSQCPLCAADDGMLPDARMVEGYERFGAERSAEKEVRFAERCS